MDAWKGNSCLLRVAYHSCHSQTKYYLQCKPLIRIAADPLDGIIVLCQKTSIVLRLQQRVHL